MDTTYLVIGAGYAPLITAIAVLYKDLREARKELVNTRAEHTRILAELYSVIRENKEDTTHE